MKVANILYDSVVDGTGTRTVIFFQGCSIGCKGCHNPESHNKRCGHNYTPQKLVKEICGKNFNNRITLSGGEPLEQKLDQLEEFICLFRKECKKRSKRPDIWLYSGHHYTVTTLQENDIKYRIFKMCNVLVDGPFIVEQKKELPFRGSENQRIIDLKRTFATSKITLQKLR